LKLRRRLPTIGTVAFKGDKRDISITVKMSRADLDLLEKASRELWGDAPITKSSALLALMRRAAKAALGQKPS
jgi:hypothetical protein